MGQEERVYLLLDSGGSPLARGKREGPTTSPSWQIRVLDNKEDEVLKHTRLQLMAMTDSGPSYEGTIVRSRNDMIQLEVTKIRSDGNDKRQNLRVLSRFKSCIYPVSGRWKGRLQIEGNDISCGGVAFFCERPLEVREVVEIVVPVTAQPLVVRGEILRQRPTERQGVALYAAKFVDLCDDEEMVLREAVFSLQLLGRR